MDVLDGSAWAATSCTWLHTARGVTAGWVEARLARKDQDSQAASPLPDLSAELRKKNPDWRLLRLVLHDDGPEPLGAKRFPVNFFSVQPRPLLYESQDVSVSFATEEDRSAWQHLYVEYRASQIPPGTLPYESDEVAADAVWGMSLRGRQLDARTADILIARGQDGTVLGAATVARLPAVDGAGAGAPRGFLGDLFVSPKAHGKGVGRALMAQVMATCKDAGFSELCWYCIQSNEKAMSFYRNLGFVPTAATVWQYPDDAPSAPS
eukprot:s1538_g7.t1